MDRLKSPGLGYVGIGLQRFGNDFPNDCRENKWTVSVCYLLDFAKLKAIVTGFGVVPAEIPIFGTGMSTIVLIQVLLLNNFLSLVINFFFLTQNARSLV